MEIINQAINHLKILKNLDTKMKEEIYDFTISVLEEKIIDNWILCSDVLPTVEECQINDCRFIVTDGNRTYQRYFDYIGKVFIEPFYGNTMNSLIDSLVIAWQPLPEPYKGE